jgi:hypothetical protein
VAYQKMKSGIILLPIGLSVNTLKDIIFKLILATAATERCWCGNHSAFFQKKTVRPYFRADPFRKIVIEKYLKSCSDLGTYALLELALGSGFSAGMSEQGRLKEEG